MNLPRLYAIVDVSCFAMPLRTTAAIVDYARDLASGGATLIQYRNKIGTTREMLDDVRELRRALAGNVILMVNDRADVCIAAELQGVHVGQDDLSPEDARRVVGANRVVGASTHTDDQVRAADSTGADYIAIGPAFATGTKIDTEPVVGLEGIRRARALTAKPLVAIGGITRANARSVLDAGADSIAVISALLAPGESVEQVARDFLELLR